MTSNHQTKDTTETTTRTESSVGRQPGEGVQKFLFGWFSLAAAVIGAIVSITLAVTKPDAEMRQDIALIKQSVQTMQTNELVHIQARLDEQQSTIITILQEIAKNQALLEQHLSDSN